MAAGESPPVGDAFIDLQQVRWESGTSSAMSIPGTAIKAGCTPHADSKLRSREG